MEVRDGCRCKLCISSSTDVSDGSRQFGSSLRGLIAFCVTTDMAIAYSITRLVKYLSSVLITS
jgi:hypothetical protein